jgi:UDP-GlcNAc:undecaprenyl-phosphate GlcNAc-1-phosphate transferase
VNADVSAAVGFATAAAVACAATPLALRVARRTGLYDHPREYRKHASPTPFLGGAAVLAGFCVAAIAVGGVSHKHILIACAIGMWAIGTLDDRFAVSPWWRLLAEALAATALVAGGLGWNTSLGGVADYVLTVLWVVGLVNAFNLMDNLDGACSTVGSLCGIGIGTLAVILRQPALAGVSFATAGACAGFLPWNLAGPAKIFLGDGGSMPIGLMIAALSMGTVGHLHVGDAKLLACGLLVGLPIFDTALVSVSRSRRGVTLLTGGRDHLTHRLLRVLKSPRKVAAILALCQACLSGLALLGNHFGTSTLAWLAAGAVAVGLAAIAVLDSDRWRPAGIAVSAHGRTRPSHTTTQSHRPSSVGVDSG